jgi:hypothetical protein
MTLPRPSQLPYRRRLRPALALALLVACVALAACGSSATSSTSTNNASTGTAAAPAQGAGSGRFAALRSCLQKQGITLPPRSRSRTPGAPGAPGGPLGGGGRLQLPNGVSQTQFQEALKKCGAGNLPAGGRSSSATAKAAFTRFAACMRENGVNLPAPNTSGNGPIFNTGGIDTSGATFKAAEAKCRGDLRGAFGGRGGAPGGAPPSAGGAPAGKAGGA